jgi:Putative MetA-pathway of phenol degradation
LIKSWLGILRGSFVCILILSLFLALFCSPAHALTKDDDIDTNRPSFMDSPLVVPKFSLQLENGTLYQHFQHGVNYWDASETEVRFGLTDRTEFQMFVPNFVLLHSAGFSTAALTNSNPAAVEIQTTPSQTQAGVSDLTEIGIKRQIGPFFKDLNVSIIAGVSPPTGARFISGSGTQPVFRMPWTKQLSKNWQIGGMQSYVLLNSGSGSQYQNFNMIGRSFGSRTFVFTEYAGFYTRHAAPTNIAHFGVVRKVSRNTQIDTHFGFGLNKSSPVAFIGVGYSYRFDKYPW